MSEKKYYSEEIKKDYEYRKDYADSINRFLEREKTFAEKARAKYVDPDKYIKNPQKYRTDFVKMLGFPLTSKRKRAKLLEKNFVAADGNVNIFRLKFSLFGDVITYGILFAQKEKYQERPFMFCLHGGGGTPEVIGSINLDSEIYHHLVRRYIDKGVSVYCPQLLLWDKNIFGSIYDRTDTDSKLKQLGGSITAMETLFLSQTLDYFIEKEGINGESIGVTGFSYGGMYALSFAAYDERVKVCYSSGFFNDRFKYSWADWSYFGAQKRFTDPEVAALICPRTLVISVGDKDCMFDARTSENESEIIKRYYDRFGKSSEFMFYIYNADHEFDKGDKGIDFILKKI